MKTIPLALTVFVVATGPFTRAQEATAIPPEATAPEQSPAPASNPSASISTETSASPAANKRSSPAEPSKASSPAKTSATTAKAAPPATVMPTKKSTPEATLKDIENKGEASIMSHDPTVAQAYLGNDYRGVSSKGKILNKSSLLAEIKRTPTPILLRGTAAWMCAFTEGTSRSSWVLPRKLAKIRTARRSSAAIGGRMPG